MNSATLTEIVCKNGIKKIRLLFFTFSLINISTSIYYFKFNIQSCFDSKINLFLAMNFHNYKNYTLDNLPLHISSTFNKKFSLNNKP